MSKNGKQKEYTINGEQDDDGNYEGKNYKQKGNYLNVLDGEDNNAHYKRAPNDTASQYSYVKDDVS